MYYSYLCLFTCVYVRMSVFMYAWVYSVVLFEPVSSRGLPCWDPIQSRPAVVVARANFATPRKKALHDMTLPSLPTRHSCVLPPYGFTQGLVIC